MCSQTHVNPSSKTIIIMSLREKAKLGLLLGSFLICGLSLLTSQKSFEMGTRDLPVLQPQVTKFCHTYVQARNRQCHRGAAGSSQQLLRPDDATTSMISSSCRVIEQHVSQCEKAVQKAYRSINMGGCPHELRDVTLCELERCGGYHGVSVIYNHLQQGGLDSSSSSYQVSSSGTRNRNIEGCVEHCQAAQKTLERCVTKHVQEQLQHYGVSRTTTTTAIPTIPAP